MQKLALNKSVAPALEISHYLKKKLSYDCTREITQMYKNIMGKTFLRHDQT